MSFEKIKVIETKTNGAPTEETIQLIAEIHGSGGKLVPTEIKCSNDQRIGPDALRDVSISFVLFILCRQRVAVQIQELRAIKADSFCAVGCNSIDIIWKFDVGGENDVTSIAGSGLGFAKGFQLRHDLDSSRFDFVVTRQRLGCWIDNDQPIGPVEQHVLTGLEFFCDIVQTNHRGDV